MSGHSLETTLLDLSTTLVEVAVNWFLQSSLLITLGLLAGLALRKWGSAAQSVVYRTTLVAVLICPLATWLLAQSGVSGWSIEMPAAWAPVEPAPADGETTVAQSPAPARFVPASPLPSPAPQPQVAAAPVPMDGMILPNSPLADVSERAELTENAIALLSPAETANIASPTDVATEKPAYALHPFGIAAVLISACGLSISTMLLARLALAWWELARLRRGATAADAATRELCAALASQMQVKAPSVLRSPYVPSPCLAGLLRPTVLLPEEQIQLPLRDVLIHELAHLHRHDCDWKLLHRLATSLFFFQPLLWKLARSIDGASEEVCDDYVMQFGGDRQRYAHGLVDVAELSAIPAAAIGAAGVGIISLRSMLAHRVARIMDTSRTLSTRVGSLLVALVLLGGLIGTSIVGLVGLKSQASFAETLPDAIAVEMPVDDNAADQSDFNTELVVATVDPNNASAPATVPVAAPVAPSAAASDQEIDGRVMGADGKAVAGAQIYWFRTRVHDLEPMTPRLIATTDDAGKFRFTPPAAVDKNETASWSFTDRIVIKAPGHGVFITNPSALRAKAFPSIANSLPGVTAGAVTLPAAGQPIRGRLVDIDGRPIAGALVRTRYLNDRRDADNRGPAPPGEDKAGLWSRRANMLLNVIEPAPLRDVLPQAITDADGRFSLADLGANRIVQLLVEGPGIETTEIVAQNETAEELQLPPDRHSQAQPLTVYGRELVRAIGPSRPVTGQVVDIDTGLPLADAVVRANQIHGQRVSSSREREEYATRTDADGRYRLTGLPIGKENTLVAFTMGDTAYVPVGFNVDTAEGDKETPRDFKLKQGVWAEGRVFDAESQKPFLGEISYYFFVTPELKESIPGVNRAYVDGLYWTNGNGDFRLPILPVRGVLAFRYEGASMNAESIESYPRGYGAETIAGRDEMGHFRTTPFYLLAENYERVLEVHPTADQTTVRADMPLFASPQISVRVVDAAGKPATGFSVYGARDMFADWQEQSKAEVAINALKPKELRKVFAFDRERNLAGAATVSFDQTEDVQITLQPAGSVIGRIVDTDGVPITDVSLYANYEKLKSDDDTAIWANGVGLQFNPTTIPVDSEGKFRLDGLISGMRYNAHASAPRKVQGVLQSLTIGQDAIANVIVKPGEVKDLGDVVVGERDKKTETETKNPPAAEQATADKTVAQKAAPDAAPAAETQSTDVTFNYRGLVVDDQQQPIAGARIFMSYWHPEAQPDDAQQPVATTDAEGRFDFNVALGDLKHPEARSAWLCVTAPGRGLATVRSVDLETTGAALKLLPAAGQEAALTRQAKEQTSTIQLVADSTPISGQVVTTEGQAVVGARIRLKDLWIGKDGSLNAFEQAAKRPKTDFYSLRNQTTIGLNGPQLPSIVPDATTDAQGRFTLAGIGRERVVELIISGPGIETRLVRARTRAGETITVPHQWPPRSGMRDETFLPSSFVHVVGPSQPVTGRITDADSNQPIAGVLVSAGQAGTFFQMGKPHIATRTQADGQYRLEGLPIGSRESIYVFPPIEAGFIPSGNSVTLKADTPPATIDFRLKRGVWVRGQAVDKRTGKPIRGHVEYYAFDDNPHLNSYPGFSRAGLAHERRTDTQGKFEIAVIPGSGILAFIADDHTQYRRGVGADKITGASDDAMKFQIFRTVPSQLFAANKHFFHQVDLAVDGAPLENLKLELDSGVVVVGKLLDPNRKPLTGVIACGAMFNGSGWYDTQADTVRVEGYYPDQPRDLFFFQPERNLAGLHRLEGAVPEQFEVALAPAGNVSGRLIEDDGSPVIGAQLAGVGVPSGNFGNESLRLATDKEGRFLVRGLLPGRKYTIGARTESKSGTVAIDVSVTAGETKDLGDVKLLPIVETAAIETPAAPVEKGPVVQATPPAVIETAQRVQRGRIVDSNDKPIGGVKVAAAGMRINTERGGSISLSSEILAETTTAQDGGFQLQFTPTTAKTHRRLDLLARADGLGLGWKELNREDAEDGGVTIKLLPEELLRGRLVDIDGQPIEGVECHVKAMMARSDKDFFAQRESIGFRSEQDSSIWPTPAPSDKDGKFVVHGIPPNFGAYLNVDGNDRVAPQGIMINTGAPEQRGERDATYRPLVKNGKPGEELVLPLSPAQRFEGNILYDDTGAVVPGARISIWASQEQFGSMSSVKGEADDQGHYKITAHPGIRFGVSAFPPSKSPYLSHQTPLGRAINWETADRVKQLDIRLKRGVAVQGTIVDGSSGAPIAGASIQYIPESKNNTNTKDTIVTRWQGIQTSDERGEFYIVVLPGPGRLLVHGPDGRYILQEISGRELYSSKPGGQRNYAHAIHKIDPAAGQDLLDFKISLQPGATVRGRMVDEQGVSATETLIISPLNIRAFWLTWNGNTESTPGEHFEIAGIAPDREVPVYFLDAKRRLGAARKFKATDDAPTVVLQPCGEATARFVDKQGQPKAKHHPTLEIVFNSGAYEHDTAAQDRGEIAAVGDYVGNVDRTNHQNSTGTDDDGRIVFPALIPGATYRVIEVKAGKMTAGKEFTVTPGQRLDLGEFVFDDDKP